MRFHRSRIVALTAVSGSLVGLMSCTQTVSKSEPAPSSPPIAVTDEASSARAFFATAPLGHVVSRDAAGTARFIVGASQRAGDGAAPGTGATPPSFGAEAAARIHLSRHANLLGLTESSVQDAVVSA